MSENTSGLVTTLIGPKGKETETLAGLIKGRTFLGKVTPNFLAQPIFDQVRRLELSDHDTFRTLTNVTSALQDWKEGDGASRKTLLEAASMALHQYIELKGYVPAGEQTLLQTVG